jgi:hypothetical protein
MIRMLIIGYCSGIPVCDESWHKDEGLILGCGATGDHHAARSAL